MSQVVPCRPHEKERRTEAARRTLARGHTTQRSADAPTWGVAQALLSYFKSHRLRLAISCRAASLTHTRQFGFRAGVSGRPVGVVAPGNGNVAQKPRSSRIDMRLPLPDELVTPGMPRVGAEWSRDEASPMRARCRRLTCKRGDDSQLRTSAVGGIPRRSQPMQPVVPDCDP